MCQPIALLANTHFFVSKGWVAEQPIELKNEKCAEFPYLCLISQKRKPLPFKKEFIRKTLVKNYNKDVVNCTFVSITCFCCRWIWYSIRSVIILWRNKYINTYYSRRGTFHICGNLGIIKKKSCNSIQNKIQKWEFGIIN